MADRIGNVASKITGKKKRLYPIDFLTGKLYTKYVNEACKEIIGEDDFFYTNDTIKTVFNYFYGTPDFNTYGLVQNEPSLDKGLMIFGDYGVGKTVLMNIICLVGKKLIMNHGSTVMHIMSKTAPWFTEQYMQKAKDKSGMHIFNLEHYYKGRLYIDDVGMEEPAFKDFDVITDILFHRHRNQVPTFLTTNLKPEEFGERYGARIADRMPKMFNIIKFEGKSLREE